MISTYQASVCKSFTLSHNQIVKDLTLFDRIPVAMEKVLVSSSAKFVDKSRVLDGSYYRP